MLIKHPKIAQKKFWKNREFFGCFINTTNAFSWTGNGNRFFQITNSENCQNAQANLVRYYMGLPATLKKYGAIVNSMLCYEILRDLCNCSFLTMVKSSFSSSSDKLGQSDWTLRTTFFIILSSRPWTQSRYNRGCLSPISNMDFQFWAIWAAQGQ